MKIFGMKASRPALAFIGVLSSAQVWAQTAAQLEHIEVTAQKRVQNLQTVPVAVTAISGNELQETVSFDIYDVQNYVPAFSAFQSQSATNSSFSIRGIGTSSQNFGFESSVGLYVDGVYRSRQNSVINDLVDIQAVEILRGPQGTLFGKNTPAGAVSIRTRPPVLSGSEGFISASIGNENLRRFAGAASFEAVENILAFRLAGFTTQRDGWIAETVGGVNLNNRDRSGVRLQALYKPAENVQVRIIGDYAELDELCCGALTWQDNRQAMGEANKYGSDTLLLQPPFNATLYTRDDFYRYTTSLTAPPVSQMKDKGLSAQIDWEISPLFRLVSITAHRQFDSLDDIDTDFTNVSLLNSTNDAHQQAFSQELQLHYQTQTLNTIVGAYYFSQNLDLDFSINTGKDFPAFFSAQSSELQPLITGINGLSVATGGLIAPVAAPAPADTAFAHNAYQEQDSVALFAQADWQFLDEWSLIAGLRYTHEDKALRGSYYETGPGINNLAVDPQQWPDPQAAIASFIAVSGALATGKMPDPQTLAALTPFQRPGWGYYFLGTASVLPRPQIEDSLSDSQITGTAKLSWQPQKHQLIYLSFASGFKSGGMNTDRIAAQLDPEFDAEKSRSLEMGLKQEWQALNLRLNLAAHITEITDFQASTFTGTGFNLQNAGNIDTKGIEAELTWLPFANTRLDVNFTRTLASFNSFEKGTCWSSTPWHFGTDDPGRPAPDVPYCSRSGDRLGFEPETAFSIHLSQDLRVFSVPSLLSVDYQYTGDLMLDDSNDPLKYSPSFSLVNLRWQFTFPAWDTSVIFWGRNVLDEEYVARNAFDVPVQTGKIMAYPGEPASYGVTLQKIF